MTLTPEIEATGLKAYEQARAFERLRSWRLPLSYALFPLIPAACAVGLWRIGQTTAAALDGFAAILIAAAAWSHWKRLCARYAENQGLLAELERTYGDQLPWVQVEHHFVALEKLKRELSEEKK